MVALERGDTENHLHFQMVYRARVKSSMSFAILARKYMGWYGIEKQNPVDHVCCKVLSNKGLHTFQGMVGYRLKDTGTTHFECVMHNISDNNIVEGKTLHAIFGRFDLKHWVILTHKNITDRMYVWHKYKKNWKLTAAFMNVLIDMIQSGLSVHVASWIIPYNKQGIDHCRMCALFKIMIDPVNCRKEEVTHVFMKKWQYMKGRYFDDDGLV